MNPLLTALFALSILVVGSASIDNPKIDGRIRDGDEAEQGSTPYMVSLRSMKNVHFCGGAIISNRFVLTSAQCIYKRVPATVQIIVGTLIRTDVTNAYRTRVINMHPGFNPDTLQNDIALVLTATTIILTENIRTADIHPDLYVENLIATVSGWGIVSRSHYDPINLHTKNVTLISNEDCRMQLQRSGNAWHVTENKICTSAVDNQGICYGDEGGALIYSYAIVGIASWHSYCSAGIPNVYERISGHRLWIMSNVGINEE